ncbi:unnamed protein product [Hymenolepis diminuta]|uniref:GRIP domain-containing protein n=1 Tax=Hymenolepis diminuta TaxID=6216 RepID=A0A564XWW5_HYMDI|nr:unnamed protein product [Hymenolepis diminuta]
MKSEKEKIQQELQQRITTLEKDVERRIKLVSKLKQEKEDLRIQIEAKAVEIGQLKETNSQHESSTQQTSGRVAKLEDELNSLRKTNEDLRVENENLRQTHQTQFADMREQLASVGEELKASQDKFAESQNSVQSAELECQELREVQATLQSKIVEMEKDFADRIAENASKQKQEALNEVTTLRASIDELNEVISDRNKTIRLQKQKLLELKKALGQGLRQSQGLNVTASNLSLTEVDSHNQQQQQHRNSLVSGPAGGNGISGGPSLTVDELTLPPLYAISQQTTSAAPPPPSPQEPSSPPAILPLSTEQTMSMSAPRNLSVLSPTASTASLVVTANSQHETDVINFEYMRHVLLKFLLSHDTEALQLVRAVATVLRLSKKDEFLIRQKLEERRSWFNTPVVAAKSSGQFAKMLPPS